MNNSVAEFRERSACASVLFLKNRSHYYLRPNVPMSWLYDAMALRGKTTEVAIELAFLSGVKKSTEFSFSAKRLEHARIGRHSVYRALSELAKAGLIQINRKSGRKTIVKINFPPLVQKHPNVTLR